MGKKIGKKHYSFKKAYQQISVGDISNVRKKLWDSLGIKNRASFSRQLNNGFIDPRLSIIEAVNNVFKEHEVENAWEIKLME